MRNCTCCREEKRDPIFGCVEHVLNDQPVEMHERDRDTNVGGNRYVHRYCIHKVSDEKYEFCSFFATCIWRRVPTSQRLTTEGFCWEHVEKMLAKNQLNKRSGGKLSPLQSNHLIINIKEVWEIEKNQKKNKAK